MGLYCMESLGKRYQEADETYDLYEEVLKYYLPFIQDQDKIVDGKYLKVSDEDNETFIARKRDYYISNSTPVLEANEVERLSDSLMFYEACELLVMKDGSYYIDIQKLKEKFLEYQSYKEKKKSAVYSKGPRK